MHPLRLANAWIKFMFFVPPFVDIERSSQETLNVTSEKGLLSHGRECLVRGFPNKCHSLRRKFIVSYFSSNDVPMTNTFLFDAIVRGFSFNSKYLMWLFIHTMGCRSGISIRRVFVRRIVIHSFVLWKYKTYNVQHKKH